MRLSLMIVAALLFAPAARADRLPSVVLIVADDLGWGELGCYGQKKIRTPELDRLAREGTRFTQFYAGSPVCAPSRCCLMTGKHGGHAWVRNNKSVKPEGQEPIPASEVMLSEVLAKLGLATGAMGKWGMGPPGSSGDPLKRGFGLFFGYNCQAHAHSHYPTWVYRNDKRVELDNDGKKGKQHTHDLFEKEALAFLDANRDRSFFLFLPITIPHVALQADDEWMKEYRALKWPDPPYVKGAGYLPHPTPRAAYAAMITRMDRTVGKVREKLRELKRDRDTLVLFTSDNGATHQAGGADTKFFESVGPLRGWKGSVYEGGIRVPLIAWQPGAVKAAAVSDHIGYNVDVMATVLDWLGKPGLVPKGTQGLSFAPALRGEKQRPHAHLMWEFQGYGGQQAVRVGDWKGVRRNLMKGPAALELYNLRDDVGEAKDVAKDHPDVVKRLEKVLDTDRVPSKLFPIKGLGKRS